MPIILGTSQTIEYGPVCTTGGTLYTTDNLVPADFSGVTASAVTHAGQGIFRITFVASLIGELTITLTKVGLTSSPWLDNVIQPPWPERLGRVSLYLIFRKYGKDVTIVRRTAVSVDRLTGQRLVTEQRWTGVAGFIPYRAMPRKDQVVVVDAWFITDQQILDKDELHCMGGAYGAVGISQFDNYCVVAAKMAATGEIDVSFRSDQPHAANITN